MTGRERAPGDPITVIGAGVVGLCSAYYLSEAGFAVRVVERDGEVGRATSFANGGMLTPGMSEPWNAPGILWKLLGWLGRPESPMLLRASALHRYIGWGREFIASSSAAASRAATIDNLVLSLFSLEQMRALRDRWSLDYGARVRATLKVYSDAESLRRATLAAESMRGVGVEFAVLDRDGVVAAEPQLEAVAGRLTGGLRFLQDEVGDAHRFCLEMKRVLAARGVPIDLGVEVRAIRCENARVRAIATVNGDLPASAVVVAAAAWSTPLLKPHGIRLSMAPVKGYSLTVDLAGRPNPLSLAVIDNELHTAAIPIGAAVRLAGTAEFAGWNDRVDPRRIENLWRFLDAMLPGISRTVDRRDGRAWCGFRPMSPDGLPYIGSTPIAGLYVNTGHGHIGWTQAAGSGRLLAQLVAGAPPTIDPRPFAPMRGRR